MTEYPNWFASYADGFFERHLSHLAGKPGLRFLQIGAFTGDASAWLMENVLTSDFGLAVRGYEMDLTGEPAYLYDVDTWAGSNEPEHEPFDWSDVERAYDEKVAPHHRIRKIKGLSTDYFQELDHGAPWFDFVYIDGDHTAAGVLSDAPPHLAPAMAIDTFTACYQDRLDILEAGLQVWVKKR